MGLKMILIDEIVSHADGNYFLRNKSYSNETFDLLIVPVKKENTFTISNSTFENCKTEYGFFFQKNHILKNVSFINFDCGDTLHISNEAIIENLKISGKKPKMVFISSEDEPTSILQKFDSLALDIYDFYGNVNIIGIPLHRVKFNTERHVPLRKALLQNVNWEKLNLDTTCYWRLALRKIINSDAEEGIFSLPKKTQKNYEKTVNDLKILKEHGYI